MSEAPPLLHVALRECVAAIEALDNAQHSRTHKEYWDAMSAARTACTQAKAKGQEALRLFDARTKPGEWA